jgi:hypothetical protein
VRLGGGSARKTDNADAFAVAVAGLRSPDLAVLRPDNETTVLRLLTARPQELVEHRITVQASLRQLHRHRADRRLVR